MIFLLLMSVFLLILTEQYIGEKRFARETNTIRVQEYYLLCGVKQAESLLREDTLPLAGTFTYTDGTISYQKKSISATLDEVTFTLNLDSGEKTIGMARYDKEKRAMVKWVEKK
ncbi:competence type IV pilus minor pilin ComGG [Mesobacillus subterraneus]|nr:competence type IV pilus minor pilin ComGG [Mesobacillus subterraneus]